MSLSGRVNDAFGALVRRLQAFEQSEPWFQNMETELFDITKLPPNLPYQERLKIYKDLAEIRVDYMEALRKLASQIDIDALMTALGIIQLYHKFRGMAPERVEKVLAAVEDEDGQLGGA